MSGPSQRPLAVIETDRLRVRFEREHGRILHSICSIDPSTEERLLASADELSGDADRGTPVLRELHVQKNADGLPVVLAVGMAARDHWSMSAAADSSTGRIVFDVACRVHGEATKRAVAYTCPPTVNMHSEQRLLVLSDGEGHAFQLEVCHDGPTGDGWQLEAPGRLVWALTNSVHPPFTLRWQYALSLWRS